MALNLSKVIIDDFINKSNYTFRIKTINPVVQNTIGSAPDYVKLSITRGYADAKRVCRFIRNAVYTSGFFKGKPVLETIFSQLGSFIFNLSSFSNQLSFDKAHNDLCSSLCGDYTGVSSKGKPGGYRITYGIAQKIVNMTLKYLFVEHILHPSQRILPNNRVEDFFHCPIDSYVLKKLRFADPSYFSMISANRSTAYFCRKPWSKLSKSDYLCFLQVLKNKLLPNVKQLEIDFYLWSTSPIYLSQMVVNHLNLPNNLPESLVGKVFNSKVSSSKCCN